MTHDVAQGIIVYDSTITRFAITDDLDARRTRRTNQSNRTICHGIDPDGEHVLYMQTNGGDLILDVDNVDAQTTWCHDMGDGNLGTAEDRVRQGHARLMAAVTELRARYEDNVEALEMINIYDIGLDDLLGSDAMALLREAEA